MLGDTAEKSKNPLKKAMRRRNAKTVQFAPPTYVEASDYDYSSDEGDGELFGGPEPKQMQQQQQQQQQQEQAAQKVEPEEDGLKVQPLKVGPSKKDGDGRGSEESARRDGDRQRPSEDSLDGPLDPKVSRKGTLRNTDSFFKDDNTETRKITLTPNLLRDDSSTSTTGSRERGPSLESLEKNGFADKVKDKKEKKEKKGMLSGLFKRKDRKAKGMLDSQDSDIEKPEESDRNSPQLKTSDESTERPSAEQISTAPVRQPSKGKLQKSQRSRDDSPQKTKGILKTDSPTEASMHSEDVMNRPGQQAATMRLVSPEQEGSRRPSTERTLSPDTRQAPAMGSNNPFNKMIAQQSEDTKPEQVKQSRQRIQLDDFDSDESSDPFADPDAQIRSAQPEPIEPTGRLSESPVHVSAADAQPTSKSTAQERDRAPDPQQPPGLTTDDSSQETSSPISTPTPEDSPMKTIPENSTVSSFRPASPSKITIPPPSRPAPTPDAAARAISPPISSESAMLPAWSDASLRAYLDDGSDIRDMLLLVNDTTGVVPVGRDHPFMKELFVEESRTVQGLSGELDRLLSGLLETRMKRAGSGASKSSGSGRSANGRVGAR